MMNFKDFQNFVLDNEIWFRGSTAETEETLSHAEEEMGLKFPNSIRWLLTNYGYWKATGLNSLPNIIHSTLARRPALPKQYIVLSNPSAAAYDRWNHHSTSVDDERRLGLIVLESKKDGSEGQIFWGRGPRIQDSSNTKLTELIQFESFGDFVKQRVEKLAVNPDNHYSSCAEFSARVFSNLQTPKEQAQENEHFLRLLGETIAWCSTHPEEANDFRSPSVNASLELINSLQSVRQYDLATLESGNSPEHEEYFITTGSSPRRMVRPAEDLAGGRLLLTQSDPELHTGFKLDSSGQTGVSTIGLDEYDQPPPATWVCMACDSHHETHTTKPQEEHQYLVSWIPPSMQKLISSSLGESSTHCRTRWIEHWDIPFRNQLEQFGLLIPSKQNDSLFQRSL